MKRLYLPLTLFIFMIMEGVALELLPASLVRSHLMIIPHWALIILVFAAIFYDENTNFSVIYAAIFGLLIDIIYTNILGVYMFTYAVSIYIISRLTKFLHSNLLTAILLATLALTVADISINVVYTMIGIASYTWKYYTIHRLLPTMLANILFLIVLYPLITKWFKKWKSQRTTSSI